MSTVLDWPATLPYPRLGRRHSMDPLSANTEMESGRSRNRRLAVEGLEMVEAQWTFVGDQFAVFKQFFEQDLVNGSGSFILNLRPPDLPCQVAFWEGTFQYSSSDNATEVSASLEIIDEL